jgi:tetratricopeptide (TPR) repeat protein
MAARVVAYLVRDSRNQELSEQLLRIVETIPDNDLDPDSMGQLALARALLLFEMGLTTASQNTVNAALQKLRRLGVANLVITQLEAGLGNINCRLGDYETALACEEKAFKMATRLGNDALMRGVGGNIALCCCRLGRHDDQLWWLNHLPAKRTAEFTGFVDMQIAYLTALSHAHRGRTDEAIAELETLDRSLAGGTPRWMSQGWNLHRADFMWIAGKSAVALKIAADELKASGDTLFSPAFAGQFARWTALTYRRAPDTNKARAIVEKLAANLQHYDAIDQVEILRALVMVNSYEGRLDSELDNQLAGRVRALPPGARSQLAVLGDTSRLA